LRAQPPKRSVAQWLFAACGVWLVGLGLYFMFVRPPLLPEDVRYMGADPEAVRGAIPGLTAWLGVVFTVMGGFMAGAGVLVGYFGGMVLPLRPRGAARVLALTGASTVVKGGLCRRLPNLVIELMPPTWCWSRSRPRAPLLVLSCLRLPAGTLAVVQPHRFGDRAV
jgi:hypothetical protein